VCGFKRRYEHGAPLAALKYFGMQFVEGAGIYNIGVREVGQQNIAIDSRGNRKDWKLIPLLSISEIGQEENAQTSRDMMGCDLSE